MHAPLRTASTTTTTTTTTKHTDRISRFCLCATRAELRLRGLQAEAAAVCAAPIADTGDVGLEKTSPSRTSY